MFKEYADKIQANIDCIKKVYKHKEMDKTPYLINDNNYWLDGTDISKIPENYFNDSDVMIDYQLKNIEKHMKTFDDIYVPFLFPWYGTGVVPSALGCEVVYPEGGDPALSTHVVNTPEDIDSLKKPDPYKDGLMPKVLATIDQMAKRTDLPISFTDPQGPLNIAISLAGIQNVFEWMYIYPDKIHDLMKFSTEVFIDWVDVQLKHIGDRHSCFPHGIYLPKEVGNVWISDDDCIIMSGDMYKEFVVPYNGQIFDHFDGGTIHFCGSGKQQIENIANTSNCKGLNNFCMGDFDQVELALKTFENKLVYMCCDFTPFDTEKYYQQLLPKFNNKGAILGTYYADKYALEEGRYLSIDRDNEKVLKDIVGIIEKEA